MYSFEKISFHVRIRLTFVNEQVNTQSLELDRIEFMRRLSRRRVDSRVEDLELPIRLIGRLN